MSESVVIHWFRRDLRLQDNIALHEALKSGAQVLCLFVLDDNILNSKHTGAARLAFLLRALESLDDELHQLGSQLFIRRGQPDRIIPPFAEEVGAEAVYFNRDYTPYARKRDQLIAEILQIPIYSFNDALLLAPGEVVKGNGDPYVVFTPFKHRWNDKRKPEISDFPLEAGNFFYDRKIEKGSIPTALDLGFRTTIPIPEASQKVAVKRLENFTNNEIYDYRDSRNHLMIAPFSDRPPHGTSYLSPYLRLGLLSPRHAYHAAVRAYKSTDSQSGQESIKTWVSELTWREFYMHILYFFPRVVRHNFRREYDNLAWRNAPDELQVWKDGRTGYPVVDAAMRQLKQIGWMPNRARMIVASFLTKDLLISWQEGEQHFMQWLLDGDPAANNGGWQWAAGTGTDAQPYFRIFNPVSQSKKFDPEGVYIRHWCPELADVPAKFIHAPWEMTSPPHDYPSPIVNHKEAHKRTLNAFKAVK